MLGKHAFLILGLLVAGGAPYLSRSREGPSRQIARSASVSQAEDSDQPVFQLASAKRVDPTGADAPSRNPFGGATTDSASTATSREAEVSNVSQSTNEQTPSDVPASASSASATPPDGRRDAPQSVSTVTPNSRHKLSPVDGSVPIPFGEVFRLDVNSAWLMARWPRVTTGLADLSLHGYRVSLVTGTREDDVAGALTYYYDPEQVNQKMTFRGATGDPRRLVLFCTREYGFEREYVSDPALQVYRKQGSGSLASELRIRPAAVIRAEAPRERFDVELLLAR